MSLSTINREIACRPGPERGIQVEVKSRFAGIKNKGELLGLEVIGECQWANVTDTVFVKGEQFKALWYHTVYDVDGQQCVLVPVDQIVLVKRKV